MEITLAGAVEKFKQYSGEAMDGQEPGRDALCQGLCGECVQWVQARLLPGAPETGREAAEGLAAAEALYQLALLDQAGTPGVVSTPELKLELGDRARYAGHLREEKRRAAAGLLREEGFYFGRI